MAQNKTTENNLSVSNFLNKVSDEQKRADAFALCLIMEEALSFPPKMWGDAIVGFGSYHYVYESGREGDAPLAGFSPRKDAIAIYLSSQFKDREELLQVFGKHKSGKACIYIKKLSDVDGDILKKMVFNSAEAIQQRYPQL
ncbi:DUF1801 domain-containing protein [Pedobacter sandarakinus]|uniref:DUF1801 domain-containing protein n=1 Tax=Pedobacter sandarakinus TaxID=353156 RepID=UPI0022461E70|nr:DUF1801 domain-containing protein [Pedobacter sandarakinus]MCX2573134.1 DUF1801 domain-containing protein [Pedobacter sandarakinus]